MGLVFVLFVVLSAALFVWWLLMLIEALRVPDQAWTAAGQNKLLWVLVIVLLGFLGALLYALIARPAVAKASPTAT